MSSLTITVAKRNADTAAQLATLGRQTFHEAFAANNRPEDLAAYLDVSFNPEKQLAELQDPAVMVLLARMAPELVGYAQLRLGSALGSDIGQVPPPVLEIERLYVLNEWIGTGLGAALMRQALEEARGHQCRSVVLGVWERNTRAIEFYQRFGFKPIGQHEFVLGTDVQTDLIMRKGLKG